MLGKEKLIVALDVDSAARALELFTALRDVAGMFKIGSQLFTAAGPEMARQIVHSGGRLFLDLKFHDIPNTVAAAAVEASRLGVSILNVHAAGGFEMMHRTADAVTDFAQREGLPKPKVIAVTVLTSMDEAQLKRMGINETPASLVGRFAALAHDAGLDGVVASPQEIKIIRQVVSADFLIVTPGIRKATVLDDDQSRVMTAGDAVRAGADLLVVGRPILNAPDPVEAAQQIADEITEAMSADARAS